MRLPDIDLGPGIEDYSAPDRPTSCDPVAKPGVTLLADFVMSKLGGRNLGIVRTLGCETPTSDHHEGRAWDWGVNIETPAEAAAAVELLDWLLSPDRYGNEHANFRRLGLRYIIWDRQVFSTLFRQWQPYTGQSPHRDHMHISVGREGAAGRTSLYPVLGGVAPIPPPGSAATTAPPWVSAAIIVGLGAAVAYLIRAS